MCPWDQGHELYCRCEPLHLCSLGSTLGSFWFCAGRKEDQELPERKYNRREQLLTSAKHILDLFVKTVTLAVCFCWHTWLQSTDLQHDTKAIVEDLPFEREGLFSMNTDAILQDVDKSIKASKMLDFISTSKQPKSKLGTLVTILSLHIIPWSVLALQVSLRIKAFICWEAKIFICLITALS